MYVATCGGFEATEIVSVKLLPVSNVKKNRCKNKKTEMTKFRRRIF
jgi:hypothetical protein